MSIEKGYKFYFFFVDKYGDDPHTPTLCICTVTKMTPERVYFTSNPRSPYGIGNIDSRHDRYLPKNSFLLKLDTPLKAAEKYEQACNNEYHSIERRLDDAWKKRDMAQRVLMKLREADQ
jgi:hypothetical protein